MKLNSTRIDAPSMKLLSVVGIVLFSFVAVSLFSNPASAEEKWKSYIPDSKLTLGISGGMGLIDTTLGFAAIGNAGARLIPEGFVPEIVNPVFLEAQFGPFFAKGTTSWMYSTHLRWDFVYDSSWTLFALGGFGGNITDSKMGDRVAFHPRLGIGAFYDIGSLIFRFDFSHELMMVGLTYPF